MVGGCTDPVPKPKPQLIKQTNLKAEPLLGRMVHSLRNEAKSSRNPDGEEDVFDQVNWNDISRYKDEEQSLYTATFLQDKGNFTDNLVVGGTADEPFAYVVRYKPEEGEFDGKISTFTGIIEMYSLEGERFGYAKLRNGEDQSHLRGEAAGRWCISISFTTIENCSTGPNDYCGSITHTRIRVCGGSVGPPPHEITEDEEDNPIRRGGGGLNRPVLVPKKTPKSKKPCPGNPLKKMEVAPQAYSGTKGGMFGKFRNQGTRQHK